MGCEIKQNERKSNWKLVQKERKEKTNKRSETVKQIKQLFPDKREKENKIEKHKK